MKKFIVIILIACAAFYYYLEHDRPENKRVFRVGVECAFIPHNWEEKTASDSNVPIANNPGFYAEGYDVQIAKIVAQALDAELIIIKVSWEDLLDVLERRQIDAVFSGMADTEERKKQAAFSDVYEVSKAEYVVVVRKDGKYVNARTLADLSGAAIVSQKDTNFDSVIEQIPGVVHVNPAQTVSDIVARVINHEADGAVMSLDSAQSYERLHSDLYIIRFQEDKGFNLGFNGVCAAVRKEDARLLNDINKAVRNIQARQRQRIMDQTISKVWKNL